jgi:hypothetical protein
MDRQARTSDAVLVKRREMTSRRSVVAGGKGVKTTEIKGPIEWTVSF